MSILPIEEGVSRPILWRFIYPFGGMQACAPLSGRACSTEQCQVMEVTMPIAFSPPTGSDGS